MSRDEAERLVRDYYDVFNSGDRPRFLALLAGDVVHDISQGGREIGRAAFAAFMQRMDRCYRERIENLAVMSDATGSRAAAEFVVRGVYVATDPDLPDGIAHAAGQTYALPAGAFFTLRNGKVARISNHYNFGEWARQVGGRT